MHITIRAKIIVTATLLALLVLGLPLGRYFHRKHQALSRLPASNLPVRVPILMYHNISSKRDTATANDVWTVQTDDFEKQLQSLRAQGYTSVLPKDLAAAAAGKNILPDKPIVITFDDGFHSSLTIAEPLLKQYGYCGIVYLITSYITDTPEQRKKYRATPCLIWPEVRAAMQRGTLTFGSHSHTHQKHPDATASELATSRDVFRARTGVRPDSFCYPHGQYNDHLINTVHATGFKIAMACEDDVAIIDQNANLLTLPRVSVFGGVRNFVVQALPQEQNEPGTVGGIVRNIGRPVWVTPQLLGAGIPSKQSWLPETRLGPEPQVWRWPIAPDTDLQNLRLEIWDRNRILLLFSAP